MKALSLFRRTSCRRTINLASWHSPHSLTWRWCLSLSRQRFMAPKPYARIDSGPLPGFGAGLGQMVGFHAYRDNNGWQWSVSLLWHALRWSQQRPIWFRNLYRRAADDRDAYKNRASELARELSVVKHNAARAAITSEELAQLN